MNGVARRGVMLVIASPSGAGKSSISRAVMASDSNIELSVSVTTRERRHSEVDGVHYHFISVREFERMRADGELLEWAEVHGNLYATPRAHVEQRLAGGGDILFDIDWQGTQQLYDKCRPDMVTVFILPPSIKELRTRLERRAEDGPDVIRKRLKNAKIEMGHWEEYDHIVINEDLETSVETVRAILRGARVTGKRLTQMGSFVGICRTRLIHSENAERSVFFDVDGVLVHGFHARPELQRRWDENLLQDLGIDPKRFSEEFIYDLFVKKVIVGQMGLIEALDRVLPQLGYRGPTMRLVAYWLEHDSQLDAGLVDVVRKLKASGARLYIATNQEHLRAQWLWQTLRLGEVFDDMFHSARIGAQKPQPRYFEEVMRRVGPQSQPPLFFDDREEVVAGARKAGWEAVLYTTIADCTGHPWIAARLA